MRLYDLTRGRAEHPNRGGLRFLEPARRGGGRWRSRRRLLSTYPVFGDSYRRQWCVDVKGTGAIA
jgi:hypothetical protein